MIHTKLRSHHLFQPRSIHRSKQKWRPRIKTSMTKLSDLCKRFANTVDENLHNCPTNRERWNHIRTAIDAFGKKERQTSRLIRIRKQQSQQRKKSWLTTKGILQESQLLHSERSETTYSVRSALRKWLLAKYLQEHSTLCWLRQHPCHALIKPHQGRRAFKIIITGRGKQTWRHGPNTIRGYTLRRTVSSVQQLRIPNTQLIMEEIDAPPFIREFEKAIESFAIAVKPLVKTASTQKWLKQARIPVPSYYAIYASFYSRSDGRSCSQNIRDANIISLYKNKGFAL